MLRFFSLSLESDFDDISWIGDHDAKGSSCQGSQDSGENGNGSLMVLSNIELFYRLIEADSQTGEDHLSLKTGTEPFIE
jgi:hypothetical protein